MRMRRKRMSINQKVTRYQTDHWFLLQYNLVWYFPFRSSITQLTHDRIYKLDSFPFLKLKNKSKPILSNRYDLKDMWLWMIQGKSHFLAPFLFTRFYDLWKFASKNRLTQSLVNFLTNFVQLHFHEIFLSIKIEHKILYMISY